MLAWLLMLQNLFDYEIAQDFADVNRKRYELEKRMVDAYLATPIVVIPYAQVYIPYAQVAVRDMPYPEIPYAKVAE